jgi:toxoflavin biosynthesis protein ToxD
VEYYAVIVGINIFKDFPRLLFAEADAKDFAELLIGPELRWDPNNVDLLVGEKATSKSVKAALEWRFIQQQISPDSLVLFYFAGHGFLDGVYRRGYLAFPDTQQDKPSTGFLMHDILTDYVFPTRARNALVILDCCYSGAIWEQLIPRGPSDAGPLGGDEIEERRTQGRIVLASCRANQKTSEDKTLKHGVLTSALLDGWSGGRDAKAVDAYGHVTFDSLYTYLDSSIQDVIHRPQRYGVQEGVIILNKRPIVPRLLAQKLSYPPNAQLDIRVIPRYLIDLIMPDSTSYIGWKINTKIDVIEPPVVFIPNGKFQMGSDESELSRWNDRDVTSEECSEKTLGKRHTVDVDSFWMAIFPVTVAEYDCFIRSTQSTSNMVRLPDQWEQQVANLTFPVTGVSWSDAQEYCRWLSIITGRSYRLPTEAEWEKAARCDKSHSPSRSCIYPWGDQWDKEKCNTSENREGKLKPVGSYPTGASSYFVQDCSGNVWEWTSSLNLPYPYTKDTHEVPDPTGNQTHVVRGSSYFNGDSYTARTAYRGAEKGQTRFKDIGFRVVRIE